MAFIELLGSLRTATSDCVVGTDVGSLFTRVLLRETLELLKPLLSPEIV